MRAAGFHEQSLKQQLRTGDPAAFRALYEAFAPRLTGFVIRFGCNREEADEIVQETFVRVWQHRHNINPDASFSTYIITIAKNIIYNQVRHAAVRDKYLQQISSQVTAHDHSPVNMRELQAFIAKAMQLLPDKCRLIFRKSRLEGYSNQQIADEMSISKSTVENQINKAQKIIRKCLKENGYLSDFVWVIILGWLHS
mgnify:FL=1|jgi:RNA polymerase sigma-70 factor (ECF subfamily)